MLEFIQKVTSIDWIIFAITLASYIPLGLGIVKTNGDGQSFTTWALWFVLDVIILKTTMEQGGKESVVVTLWGCNVGSFAITLLLIIKRIVKWTWREWVVLILVVITMSMYFHSGSYWGTVFAVISQVIAGLTLLEETWRKPEPKYNLLGYTGFLTAYTIATFANPVWDIPNKFFPVIIGIFTLITIIPLLKKLKERYDFQKFYGKN